MKEWVKKYLGLAGFIILFLGVLRELLFYFNSGSKLKPSFVGEYFLILGVTQFIQDILNKKYFVSLTEKRRYSLIVLISILTSGLITTSALFFA